MKHHINGIRWTTADEEQAARGVLYAVDWPLGAHYVIKDYGDRAARTNGEEWPFSGIRFVGGGPIGPRHESPEAAMEWAAGYLRTRLAEESAALRRRLDEIDRYQQEN
jgi:hypothetical protein